MEWASLERIVCELIALAALAWLPTRRLANIDRALRLLRVDVRRLARELARHRGRVAGRLKRHDDQLAAHERRIDRHDARAGIDTKEGDGE